MIINANMHNDDGGVHTYASVDGCVLAVDAAPTDSLYYEERHCRRCRCSARTIYQTCSMGQQGQSTSSW